MQYYDLDAEELELLKTFEEGSLIPTSKTVHAKYKAYTKSHLAKTKNVNIRLSERDVLGLKVKALEEGIPYQTLMTSVLHKFVGGRLKNVNS